MRRASELPRRRSRVRASGRLAIVGIGAFILVVVIFGRALARFYIDKLWFGGLGQSGVFWSVIRARLLLFTLFFVLFGFLAGANLAIADKLAPTRFPLNAHPVVQRFHETFGRRLQIYRYAAAAVFAFLIALPTTTQWQSWLLFRNRQSFGVADAQFGADIGFYVFELPFLSFVLDWLFFAMVMVLLLVVVTHVLNGGVMFASPIPTVSQATRGHVAVLLAVLAALKAADYWIRRYETTNERRGFVQGGTYSVVNALHPALLLLAFVAIVTAGLYLSSLRTGSWRLPLIASAVWLVLAIMAGYIYPAAVQGLVVNANQLARESEYIERNVVATRAAMGLTEVSEIPITFGSVQAADVAEDIQPLADIRLLNPIEMRRRFDVDEGQEAGLTIADLDIDRYVLDGEPQQVLVAARELDLGGTGNPGWQGRHLINTRGCGLVMAPASRVLENGRPDYVDIELDRPELYFSPTLEGYAIVGTDERESSCGDGTRYEGGAGVEMSSFLRRAAFGLAFFDYNILGSGAINSDSQMLWVRNIRDRVEKLAPFLSFDGDPYPVAVDGRVQWVTDAYTSTARYPYAQAVGGDVKLTTDSGIPRDANYVRNSVKAVVDAYDGSVTLYVMNREGDADPLIQAWQQAFPDLFTPGAEMPDELREHLRYPEDLFRVQTNVYSKYQEQYETDAPGFFERDGAWSVAQAPLVSPRPSVPQTTVEQPTRNDPGDPAGLADETSTDRFIPYYTFFMNGGRREFVMLRPYVPFSRNDERTELQAYMVASSDPGTYGELTVFTVPGPQPDGPLRVADAIERDEDVTQAIARQTQSAGSASVRFGDLQLVPINGGLLYVRPFYVTGRQDGTESSGVPEYQSVIVWYDGRVAIARTLGGAVEELFPGLELDLNERADDAEPPEVGVSDEPLTIGPDLLPDFGVPDGEGDPGSGLSTPEQMLAEADRLLREAEEELRDGNLGAYQERVDLAGQYVAQALSMLRGEAAVPESSVPEVPTDAPIEEQPEQSTTTGSTGSTTTSVPG